MRARALLVVASLFAVGSAHAASSFSLQETIDAPVADVWAAWTTARGIESWMVPHGDIDLRIGGLMRTNYKPEGTLEDKSSIANQVLAFDPERMLAIAVARAPEGFPFPNAVKKMWTVLYFDAVDERKTRLRIVSHGFTEDDEAQKMKAFFEQGNQFTLKKLQERFRK
jgi:uncharacterized protein YndB with AHSA1/START domain